MPSKTATGLKACRKRIAIELKEPLTRRSNLPGGAISLAPLIAAAQNIISETDRVFKVFLREEVYWTGVLPDNKPVLPVEHASSDNEPGLPVEHAGSGAGNGTPQVAETPAARPTDGQKVIGTTVVPSKKPSLWRRFKFW